MAAAKKRLQEIFEKFDKSGDGVLSSDEMQEIFQKLGFKSSEYLLKTTDTNKDGVIQMHEFISWLFEEKPRHKVRGIHKGDEITLEVTFFNDFKESKLAAIFASGTNVEPFDTMPATCVIPPGESSTIPFLKVTKGKEPYRFSSRVRWRCHVDESVQLSFADAEFPPADDSVDPTGAWKIAKPELWLPARCAGSPSEACLFDQILPQDVKQGRLGDCWLMGSISALAQCPGRIKSLFDAKQLTSDGKYGIWLFDETDQWIKVVIDEQVPCHKDKDGFPLVTFARPMANEIWVSLLEKAVAKYCGGYHNLQGGQPAWAFRLFTGQEGVSYLLLEDGTYRKRHMVNKKPRCPRSKWKWQKGKSLTQEEFWAALEEHAEHQHLMACCGNVKPFMKGRDKSEWKEKGLVRTHIYSILRVVSEKLDDGVPIKLIEVRNPWAWGEWNGDWCDTGSKSGESGKWLENPQLRERLLGTSGVDGAFFMSYEDFVKFFTAVSVCPLGSPEGHEPDEDVQEGSGDEDELEDLEVD